MSVKRPKGPMVGEKVSIYFGGKHPEITGIVEFISDEHITVAYGVTTKRFKLSECVAIDVIEPCEICGSTDGRHTDPLCFK